MTREDHTIVFGSAPLDVPEFRAVVLGQLGEARLDVAIEADLAGPMAHAKALDVDAKGALRDIHRRVGTTILFESSGGQLDKVAHLPELRFALGEPPDAVDTTTIDNAAAALETSGFFIRKVGTDGYRIGGDSQGRVALLDLPLPGFRPRPTFLSERVTHLVLGGYWLLTTLPLPLPVVLFIRN